MAGVKFIDINEEFGGHREKYEYLSLTISKEYLKLSHKTPMTCHIQPERINYQIRLDAAECAVAFCS
jgi:hypothetical protein